MDIDQGEKEKLGSDEGGIKGGGPKREGRMRQAATPVPAKYETVGRNKRDNPGKKGSG